MSIKFAKFVVFLSFVCAASVAQANNLTISNVSFGSRNPSTKTLVVTFDVSWENSWRNKINHDAVWLTLRLNNTASSPVYKKLCQVSAAGLNPEGSSTGSASNLELYIPSDKAGAFLRRSSNGAVANVTTTSAQLTINYDSCGFSDSDQVSASVVGFEMVFVPQGSFYAGDFNTSAASLNKGSSDSNPWSITSENAIAVTNGANNTFRYESAGNAGEYAAGSTFSVPAGYPKGYKPFYVMKYEITEGQWVEFINSLPSDAARAAHDVTDNNHKNSDSVIARNTIACSGTPLTCSTQRSSRAVNYLSWSDLSAFLDFNALRPVSELEFEKMARGPLMSMAGEYAWGTTDITAAAALSATEDGTETVTTTGANAHYGNVTLTGGDASSGAEYATGALRNGIFATSTATRVTAGAGYYGVMDLSGNVKERVVTLGNAAGLSFTGVHGDGVLTTTSGYEGNGDSDLWPGLDATAGRGVTGAAGSGFRGGSWANSADRLRISDRFEAALTSNTADNVSGGRGARTYDGN
jgi:formylglycine-generating enzyme required for sulfatase activity